MKYEYCIFKQKSVRGAHSYPSRLDVGTCKNKKSVRDAHPYPPRLDVGTCKI